jgi:hypothetical protein
MPRWASTTDRAAFSADQITMLLLMVSDKIAEAPWDDEPAQAHRAFWEHIGAQIESLLHYHVCCACLALVHEEDREGHPCGPCTCVQPVVTSIGHEHDASTGPGREEP